MNTHDPSDGYLRMVERYRQMSDEELLEIMPQSAELTDFAQQALASEARHRGLKLEEKSKEAPVRPDFFGRGPGTEASHEPFRFPVDDRSQTNAPRFDSAFETSNNGDRNNDAHNDEDLEDKEDHSEDYSDERKPVDLTVVYSERDALKLQAILDAGGFPFIIGPEEATGVDLVTSDFSQGLDVKVMSVGLPFALHAIRARYFPEDDPPDTDDASGETVRCPNCHSEDVVFVEGSSPEMSGERQEKFRWVCDACGNGWEDDGLQKEG